MDFRGFDRPAFSAPPQARLGGFNPPQTPQGKRGSGAMGSNPLSAWLSEGGALGGAAAGATIGSVVPVVGTAIGGIIGAGLGAFGGRLLENKVRDDEYRVGDAAKEGAVSAVLSGPLRLGKYATSAAKGLKAGSPLVGALTNAADDAAKFTLRGSLAKGAASKAEDLAIKGFKFTPTQLTKFANRYGEDAAQTITRHGLMNGNVDDFAKAISKQQDIFDELVSSAGTIKKADLTKQMSGVFKKLSTAGPSDTKAIGKSLQQEWDNFVRSIPDEIPATDLNVFRRQYDDLVNYTEKVANPARYGVNKRMADGIRKAIQKASGSSELQQTGMELSKLRSLAEKVAMQGNRGRGANPLSLTTLLAGGVGAGTAGLPGAVVAGAASKAVNSPTALKAGSVGARKLSEKLGASAAKAGQRPVVDAIMGAARGQIGAGLLANSAGASAQSPNAQPMNAPMSAQNINVSNDILDQASANPFEMSNPLVDNSQPSVGPFDMASVQQNIQNILANGGDFKDVGDYVSLVQALQELNGTGQQQPLNSTSAGIVSDLENGLANIRQLGEDITNSSANNPGLGFIRSKLPFDTEAQTLQANIARVKQVIGKALEGGVLRKEDEVKYAKILPTVNDTDAVAQNKIDAITSDLERKLQLYRQNLGAGGGGSLVQPELVNALGM